MVEIHAYSKAASGGKQLSAHFKVREFACGDGSDAVLVAPRLVMVLETIRAHFGAAVVINSGYRTPQYNAKVGGVAHSQHCYGMAADISVSGQKPETVAAFARSIMPDWGGRLPKGNGGAQRFVQHGRKSCNECKRINEPNCDTDGWSSNESWS